MHLTRTGFKLSVACGSHRVICDNTSIFVLFFLWVPSWGEASISLKTWLYSYRIGTNFCGNAKGALGERRPFRRQHGR